MRHKTFPLFQTNQADDNLHRGLRTCFSGLSPNSNYILLTESTVKLNEFMNEDIMLYMFDSKEIIKVKDVEFISERNMMSIELGFQPSQTAWYCLEITYFKEKISSFNPFKNLKIIGASSDEDNRIEYSLDINTANLVFYNISNSVFKISSTSVPKTDELRMNDLFSATYEIAIEQENANKRIWTKENVILKISSNDIAFSDSIDSTPATNFTENTPLLNLITFNKKLVSTTSTNYLLLEKFDSNWHHGRSFKLNLNNLKFFNKKCSTNNSDYKIKFELLWRNTNSPISTLEIEVGAKCKRYTIDGLSVRHESYSPVIYTNASWPLVFTFTVSEQIINQTIKLSTNSNDVGFLNATCKVTRPAENANAFCKQTSSYKSIDIMNVSANKGTQIEIKVWIVAKGHQETSLINSSYCLSSFTFSAFIQDFTDVTSTINNCKSLTELKLIFAFTGTDNSARACSADEENKKDLCYFVVENTSNFSLIGSSETPAKMWDFKQNPREFDIRVTTQVNTNNRRFVWATETLSDGLPTTDGTHTFYFPNMFTSRNSSCPSVNTGTNVNSKIRWKSSSFITPENISTNYANYPNLADVTTNGLNSNGAINVKISASGQPSLTAMIDVRGTSTTSRQVGILNFLYFKQSLNTETSIVTELFNTQHTWNLTSSPEFSLSFNCIQTKYTESNYIHQAFDFVHHYQSTSNRRIGRMNRFITTIFQKSFYNDNFTESSFNFIKFHSYTTENTNGICILVVDLNTADTTKYTSVIINSFQLKFLDFDNMSQYPVLNANTQNIRVGNGTLHPEFTDYINFYDEQQYNRHLLSYVEIQPIMSTSLTYQILPVKCTINSQENSEVYNILGVQKANSIYSNAYKFVGQEYSNSFQTTSSNFNNINFNPNSDKWGLSMMYPSPYTNYASLKLSNSTSTIRYLALLSNYRLSKETITLSDDICESCLRFSFSNRLEIGGTKYQFGYLIYTDGAFGSSVNTTVAVETQVFLPQIKLEGVDFPGTRLGLAMESYNASFFYSANNSIKYLASTVALNSLAISSPVTLTSSSISIKIFTSGIKTKTDQFPLASSYICASFDVNMKPNTNIAKIFTNNIVSGLTVCESKEADPVVNSQDITITLPSYQPRVMIYCCNLNVSSAEKLTVSSLELYSANETLKSYYTEAPIIVEPSESSSNYNVNVVSSLRYEPSTDNFSYNKMCLTVNLDHEIFRKMKIDIANTQMTSLEADTNIQVRCEAFINIIPGDRNRLFKNCLYNSSTGTITITTRDVVEFYTSIDKKFDVCIWPIMSKNITEKFTTSVYFDNGADSLLFPNELTSAITPKISNTNIICGLTGLITSIKPFVSGFTSNIRIAIDESNNQTFNTCMENFSNNSVNEISLYFSPSIYGVVENSVLACYVNDTVVPNCVYDNDWINLRVSVGFSEAINIDIYGFKVLSDDQLPLTTNSRILIKANAISNTSILTIAQGKASFSDSIIRSKFTEPKLEDTINLAITKLSYSITDSTVPPNTNVDITIVAALDDLVGAFGKTIERSTLKDCNVIIQLPRDLNFSQSSVLKVNDVVLPDIIDEFSENVLREYEFETISIYGRTIEAMISNDIIFNNKVMLFNFVITNVVTSYSNQIWETTRSGVINIAIKRSDLFISTIPNLYTLNTDEKLTTEFDMINNHRTINFSNRSQKFFFNFNSRFTPKPGSYRPLAMDLRPVGLIENINSINTSVEVSINSNNFFYMPGVKYSFRFNFEKSNNLMIGMNCNTLPGDYWLSFNHSDATLRLFERIPPIKVTIPFNLSKETVRLYFLEGNEITSSSNIQVGIDSIYIFNVGAVNPSVSNITVSFSIAQNTATSISPPSQVRIDSGSGRRIPSIYTVKTTATSERIRQIYQISISGNDCYSVSPSTVNFTPSITLEPISSTLNISKIISFEQEVGSNLNVLKRNELRFTFDTRLETVPVGSHIFCSLVCENMNFPNEDTILNITENKTETKFQKFYNTPLALNRAYTTIFRDLIRGMNYKLKCILRTGALNSSISRTAVAELSQIDSKVISPSPTKDIFCLNIEVKALSAQFEKETINIITEEFSSTYEALGCPVVINNNKQSVEGINDLNINRFECTKSTDVSVSKRMLQNLTSTNSTDIVEEIINPKFAVCFIQSPICPTDSNIVEISKLLNNLFVKQITTTTRTLQTSSSSSSSSSTTKLTTTKFREKLSKEIRDNFVGFQRIDIDNEFTVIPNTLKYLDMSTFKINAARKVQVKMRITNEATNSIYCSWGLNLTQMNSGFPPLTASLTKCTTDFPLCGELRVNPGANFIEFKDLEYNKLTNGKEYFLWLTCRQDIPISNIYTNPFAIGKVQVSWEYEKGVCINGLGDCKVEEPKCDGTNITQFPACCPSKKASTANALICTSSRINYGLAILLLVFLIIFN